MKGRQQEHPLKKFRLDNDYTDVQQLALTLAGTKTRGKEFRNFSATIYKIEEGKQVSRKKIESLMVSLKKAIPSLSIEEIEFLKYQILYWKYFPELRKNFSETILKIWKALKSIK